MIRPDKDMLAAMAEPQNPKVSILWKPWEGATSRNGKSFEIVFKECKIFLSNAYVHNPGRWSCSIDCVGSIDIVDLGDTDNITENEAKRLAEDEFRRRMAPLNELLTLLNEEK